jgi:hypothetical protein
MVLGVPLKIKKQNGVGSTTEDIWQEMRDTVHVTTLHQTAQLLRIDGRG